MRHGEPDRPRAHAATATGALTAGRGTTVLSGGGSWTTGTIALNAGAVLRLDNSGGNLAGGRLNATGAVAGNAGTLEIVGASGGSTQNLGALTLNLGQTSIVTSGGPVTLTFASFTTPNTGSSLNLLGVSNIGTTNKEAANGGAVE